MIKKLVIENFKSFRRFDLDLNSDINIIVGNNESGKTTILEAIHIALTLKHNGRPLQTELSPYLFNTGVANEYILEFKKGTNPVPPKILIEVYFNDISGLESLKGTNNSRNEDEIGVKVEIVFDEDFAAEYQSLLVNPDKLQLLPIEYYKINWYSFANGNITSRSLPVRVSYIDATAMKLQNGTDYYLHSVINDTLAPKDRVTLALAYRTLKETFAQTPEIEAINEALFRQSNRLTDKPLSLSIDISRRAPWEATLVPYLDLLPFQLIGQGEQHVLKTLFALERKVDNDTKVVLLEEPENHLSYSTMNKLTNKITEHLSGKQLLITTHSPYVLNKLGLDNLILLSDGRSIRITNLPDSTRDYFKKLPGYDTLRIVLAKKAILVEGPSDELIVQKAYLMEYGKLPIQDEVDVINVRGLSFARFLDIAKELRLNVTVVTDNDGNFQHNINQRYSDYMGVDNIKFCYSEDNHLKTLEPQIVSCNELAILNKIFGKTYITSESMTKYMIENKTEWAMKIFETDDTIDFPGYIWNAIKR